VLVNGQPVAGACGLACARGHLYAELLPTREHVLGTSGALTAGRRWTSQCTAWRPRWRR